MSEMDGLELKGLCRIVWMSGFALVALVVETLLLGSLREIDHHIPDLVMKAKCDRVFATPFMLLYVVLELS